MIRSLSRALFSLVALVGLAGTANAGYVSATWQDEDDYVGPQLVGGSGPSSIQYFHDITTDGFNIGSDVVKSFELTVDLYDDPSDPSSSRQETAKIDIPGAFDDKYVTTFSIGNEYDDSDNGWSIAGLFELNLLGRLSVTITAIKGDFMFASSHLVASGFAKTDNTRVPEPSTLALLGMGLLGIAAGVRRRNTPRA